jgi:hypothetical protein
MDWNSRPMPHPQVAARIVDGAAVIVLADTGEVTLLNPVGTRVWELCDGSRTAGEIVEMITTEFEVAPEQALQDVENFLEELVQAQAVVLKPF